MVPEKDNSFSEQLILYDSLLNIFQRVYLLAQEKREAIAEQMWGKLTAITTEQNELRELLSDVERKLEQFCINDKKINRNKEVNADKVIEELIREKKRLIKEKILAYKEVESVNVMLLKDSLYLAKIKASKLFQNMPFNGNTYSDQKQGHKKEKVGSAAPVIFDRMI